ncbi:MAG: hypothetical protein ACOYJS_03545, partial [Acutalibacteraceae bacterium]
EHAYFPAFSYPSDLGGFSLSEFSKSAAGAGFLLPTSKKIIKPIHTSSTEPKTAKAIINPLFVFFEAFERF